jgi:hypothetical protein
MSATEVHDVSSGGVVGQVDVHLEVMCPTSTGPRSSTSAAAVGPARAGPPIRPVYDN